MVREALQHEPRSGDEHIPIEIAALGEFQLSSDERAKFDYQMRDLERHLLTRNGDQLFWGRRALAQMQFRLGRYSEALSSLSSVEDRVEKDPYALCIKAACLHKIGNANDSRQIFAKASDLSREQLPQPLKESEPFLGIDQLYQHLLMLRETEALFAASQ
jgi:tetratricopeptide (TPR) repeat protein